MVLIGFWMKLLNSNENPMEHRIDRFVIEMSKEYTTYLFGKKKSVKQKWSLVFRMHWWVKFIVISVLIRASDSRIVIAIDVFLLNLYAEVLHWNTLDLCLYFCLEFSIQCLCSLAYYLTENSCFHIMMFIFSSFHRIFPVYNVFRCDQPEWKFKWDLIHLSFIMVFAPSCIVYFSSQAK